MIRCQNDQVRLWMAFMQGHGAVTERVSRMLEAERDLDLTWYELLVQLEVADGRLRMQDLARLILLSRSGLTRLCDRMETAALIERTSCAHDRRGTYAALTDEGRRVLESAAPVFMRGIEEHFTNRLTATEAKSLRAIMAKLCDDGSGRQPAVRALAARA